MSNIFNRIFSKGKTEQRSFEDEFVNPILGSLSLTSYNGYSSNKAMKLAAYYRGVSVISDSIAVLPLENYIIKENWKYKQQNDLDYLLNVQPNEMMSAFVFKKLMVQSIINKGNAYIFINREGSTIKSFELLDADAMQVMVNKSKINYNTAYTPGQKEYFDLSTGKIYNDADIIHLMNQSNNGLIGIPTLVSAAMSLGIAYASEEYAQGFFEGGGTMAGILSPIAGVNINATKAKQAKEDFINALGSGVNSKPNSIIVLDSGLQYSPISVKPADAQLLESRKFNLINICQFLGVPPSKVFDVSSYKYNSAEAAQIDFLNDTLLPRIEAIEIEFYRKIFTKVEYSFTDLLFDVNKLLRLDSVAQATYFSQMFQLGAITTNDIRSYINASAPVKGGNRAFVQVNVQPLDNLISEQNNQIDNKLK